MTKFKNAKEFLESLVGDDWSFMFENYDCLLLEIGRNAIKVFQSNMNTNHNNAEEIDVIHGQFFAHGGELHLIADNCWGLCFNIEAGNLIVGSTYIFKKPTVEEEKIPKYIEL